MKTKMNFRQVLSQVLNLLLVLSSAFMGYKTLSLMTDCESPVVVVLSESMEPSFRRGDLLFLDNRKPALEKQLEGSDPSLWQKIWYGSSLGIGDIVVYSLPHRPIPIVHRVVKLYESENETKFITKGDNNRIDDVGLFPRTMTYLDREKHVIGVVRGYFPYLGMITIWLTDYPTLKYVLLGALGLLTLFQKEESS
ncbi:signal peptidase subunit Sec11 [Schizosaccharomyces osmophilus]|uniref:Signal peptidase complex catalytic subunit SEC11 n=1 Tax=Schizosaccharomyces osmophilus TaxID=2545709 RepID=A0AAF0ATZ3_9SCHI|nr:signal peptidase subunit Sec11 [Schizosaccharomyces osmophilus]WBW71971.1 signal peptidase subunit Sec11 [Schizosaccharomyces osmophilus]